MPKYRRADAFGGIEKTKRSIAVVDLQKRCSPAIQSLKRELSRCKGIMTYNLKYLTGAYPEGDSMINKSINHSYIIS